MIIKTVNTTPYVALYEGVFTSEEIDNLSIYNLEFNRSLGLNLTTHQSEKTDIRTSQTAFLSLDKSNFINNKIISILNNRIENLSLNQIETVQIQKYESGQRYLSHWDFLSYVKEYKNDRIATAILYLNDDFKGGCTSFPVLKKEVTPKKGSVLFFQYNYNDKSINEKTFHSGNPVEFGTKYIASIWIRKEKINE